MPGQTRGLCILRKGRRRRSRRFSFLGLGFLSVLEQGEPHHCILVSGASKDQCWEGRVISYSPLLGDKTNKLSLSSH